MPVNEGKIADMRTLLKNVAICKIRSVLFFSRPRSEGWPHHGRTFSIYPVLCHSDWLFHRESCPRLDVVHPGRAWPPSPSCTRHCSLHYLFLVEYQPANQLWHLPYFCVIIYVSSKQCGTRCTRRIAGGPASDCGFSHGVNATERWSSTRVAAACSRCFLRSTAKVESEKKLKEKLKLKCHLKKSDS